MLPETLRLLVALLSLYRPPADVRARIVARQDQIAAQAAAVSEATGVPSGLILVAGLFERKLGADRGSGGNWGAPVSRFRRHTAGTPLHAARAMAWSFRVCGGSWLRASHRFRCGRCGVCPSRPGYSAEYAVRATLRVYRRAGIVPPADLR